MNDTKKIPPYLLRYPPRRFKSFQNDVIFLDEDSEVYKYRWKVFLNDRSLPSNIFRTDKNIKTVIETLNEYFPLKNDDIVNVIDLNKEKSHYFKIEINSRTWPQFKIVEISKNPKKRSLNSEFDFDKQVNEKYSFAFLAPLIEIKYKDLVTEKFKTIKFPHNRNEKFILMWNPHTKELWGIRNSRTKDLSQEEKKHVEKFKKTKSYKIYKDFNGYEDTKIDKTQIKEPLKWEELGIAEHIVYKSDKFNKNKFYEYIHPFGDNGYIQIKNHGVKFYYDKKNKIFRVTGGKLTVNERGIVY